MPQEDIPAAQAEFEASIAEAVDDSKSLVPEGAFCFICLNDGDLVRGCACRGQSGWVHVGCLVRHAEAQSTVRRGRGGTVRDRHSAYFAALRSCVTCKQEHEGPVNVALARAAWLRFCGDELKSNYRLTALGNLGAALCNEEDDVKILEAQERLSALVETAKALHGDDHATTIKAEQHLANALQRRGPAYYDEAHKMLRRVHAWKIEHWGEDNWSTLETAGHLADSLCDLGRFAEAVPLIQHTWECRRAIMGFEHVESLEMAALLLGVNLQLKEYEDARLIYNQLEVVVPRVLGPTHGLAQYLLTVKRQADERDLKDRRAAARAAAMAAVAQRDREVAEADRRRRVLAAAAESRAVPSVTP